MKDLEQMKKEAMERWKPFIDKVDSTMSDEKKQMLAEYAQAHQDAIEGKLKQEYPEYPQQTELFSVMVNIGKAIFNTPNIEPIDGLPTPPLSLKIAKEWTDIDNKNNDENLDNEK